MQIRHPLKTQIHPVILLIVAALFVSATVQAEQQDDPVYLSSQGMQLTAGEWADYLEMYPDVQRFKTLNRNEAEEFVRSTMNHILARRLLIRQVAQAGLASDEATAHKIQAMHYGKIADWISKTKLSPKLEPTEAEIKQAYQERIEKFRHPDKLEVRQIYLETKDLEPRQIQEKKQRAEELIGRLREDPSQFRELALQYSDSQINPKDKLLQLGPADDNEGAV